MNFLILFVLYILNKPNNVNTCAPLTESFSSSGPVYPFTFDPVFMCDKSAATPGVCTISYNDNSVIRGDSLRSNDNGCPMPPLAPRTATLWLH